MRGGAAVARAQEAVPEALTPVLVALTHLGDPLVVLVLLAGGYWLGPRAGLLDRSDGARLLAIGFVALALTVALKAAFGLPRPPESMRRIAEDGAGFPSGHATAATAAYGGLAALLDRWRPRDRAAVAAGLVATVAATRVALGVHYLVDVVAGVAVGLATIAGVLWLTRGAPGRGFLLATAAGGGAVAAAGATVDAVTALAGAAGAAAAWYALDRRDASLSGAPIGVVLVGGAVALGAVAGVLAADPPLPVVVATMGAVGAAVVALPAVRTSRGTSPSPTH